MKELKTFLEGILDANLDIDITSDPVLAYILGQNIGWNLNGGDIDDFTSDANERRVLKQSKLRLPGQHKMVTMVYPSDSPKEYYDVALPDSNGVTFAVVGYLPGLWAICKPSRGSKFIVLALVSDQQTYDRLDVAYSYMKVEWHIVKSASEVADLSKKYK